MSPDAREALADAMGEAWLADMTDDGRGVLKAQELIARSRAQVTGAPALLVACLELSGAKRWTDARRQSAERDMFVQSLGAALQNILLAAVERGLVGYLKGAPLFCGPEIREALQLPEDWEPAFLVLLGYAEEGFAAPARVEVDIGEFIVER
jgi:coenzyme F420-0:L-glutamate ligase/coenzyme F420-1:gamma-L-glutamate ligase